MKKTFSVIKELIRIIKSLRKEIAKFEEDTNSYIE